MTAVMELSIRSVGGDLAIPATGRERRQGDGTPFTLDEQEADPRPPPEPAPHEHGEIAPPEEGEAGLRLDVTA